MKIEVKIQRGVNYTGKKSRTGKIVFDENGRMMVFVSYCPDCRAKVTMSLDNAKRFATIYAEESRRVTTRLLGHMTKRRTI